MFGGRLLGKFFCRNIRVARVVEYGKLGFHRTHSINMTANHGRTGNNLLLVFIDVEMHRGRRLAAVLGQSDGGKKWFQKDKNILYIRGYLFSLLTTAAHHVAMPPWWTHCSLLTSPLTSATNNNVWRDFCLMQVDTYIQIIPVLQLTVQTVYPKTLKAFWICITRSRHQVQTKHCS